MLTILAYVLAAAPAVPEAIPDLWTWISTTTSPKDVLNTVGAVGLAILFATDRIMTRGGHERRVKDLVDFHTREMATLENANRDRIAGLVESRTEYKKAFEAERDRADKATQTLGEFADVVELIPKLLSSDTAPERAGRNEQH